MHRNEANPVPQSGDQHAKTKPLAGPGARNTFQIEANHGRVSHIQNEAIALTATTRSPHQYTSA
jgi:hypothetical protein